MSKTTSKHLHVNSVQRMGIAIACFLLCSCEQTTQPRLSFYYWKTVFKLSTEEKRALKEATKLYVRYLDVVIKEKKIIPLSPVVFKELPASATVVPVVYIRNEVMLQKDLDVSELAEKIMKYVEQINSRYAIACAEIQIDCDWTATSKEVYFAFIRQLKMKYKKIFSVTIRLHQIKYPEKMGIPPADQGVLMYYNMGRIAADASNSIYERSIAQRYIGRLNQYPLALNVALPIFTWGIHIRGNKVIGILNKVNAATFKNVPEFEMINSRFFDVRNNTFNMERYFHKGDRIKIESVSEGDLLGMVKDLQQELKVTPQEIIFYDLDEINLKRYTHETHFFQTISAAF